MYWNKLLCTYQCPFDYHSVICDRISSPINWSRLIGIPWPSRNSNNWPSWFASLVSGPYARPPGLGSICFEVRLQCVGALGARIEWLAPMAAQAAQRLFPKHHLELDCWAPADRLGIPEPSLWYIGTPSMEMYFSSPSSYRHNSRLDGSLPRLIQSVLVQRMSFIRRSRIRDSCS